jgi:glycolate oxidase iron-sulfur subunit
MNQKDHNRAEEAIEKARRELDATLPTPGHLISSINELYMTEAAGDHLDSLLTDLGEKTLYDAAAQCNRCGYCETVCPTYVLTGRETISARGRNQFMRLLVEGKAKNPADAKEALSTCLLCGACSSACYAKVPTADIVLEGRRTLTGYGDNLLARTAVRTLLDAPWLFSFWLKICYLVKLSGLPKIASALGLYHLLGMPGLAEAEASVDRVPLRFASEILRKDPDLAGKGPVKWAYFAACGPNFLFTDVALATVRLLKRYAGEGIFIENQCCGLLAHNYGKLSEAREFARRNIARYEEAKAAHGEFAIIADCASCAAFMKTYEQLFTGDEAWRARARDFSAAVKDILEFIKPEDLPSPAKTHREGGDNVTYHDSCRACHGQGIRREPRAVLRKLAGKRYVELPESEWCCGGAGAYAYTQPEMSARVLDRKLRNIASVQATTVVVGATSCLIQINQGLKMAYPQAEAVHYSVFVDKASR